MVNFIIIKKNKFQASGNVIFGERVKLITIYESEDHINKIEDPDERSLILRVHRDIHKYNWQPKKMI